MLYENDLLIICHKNYSIIDLDEEAIPKVFMGQFGPPKKILKECRIKLIKNDV